MNSPKDTTHFGFKQVARDEKAGLVEGVFTSVAQKYDLMNDAMSMGIHRIWKDALIDWLAPFEAMDCLDVAGGTGDIAFRILERVPSARLSICDLTHSMLEEGKKRAEAKQFENDINWVCGDAMALPFPDNSFDSYTISFGIRNVTDIAQALNEAFRVLRPGGRLLVLEFARVPNPALRWAYDRYSFNIIPPMGKMLVGDADSYQYLVESIRKFPHQSAFLEMIRQAGFEQTGYRNMSMGIVALHSGWKL